MGEEGDWLETHCREAHIPYRRVPHLRRAIHPVHDLLALRAFREVLRDIRPRAIHLNSSKAGVIGSLAARSLSLTPIVYCIAGWAVLDSSSWWQRFAYFWPERLTAWAKDEIVCLHPGDEQYAKRHGIIPRQGLTVIPNGIDVDTVRADLLSRQKARDELGLPHEALVIGTIANFYPAKDLPTTIEAFAGVARQEPRAHLCIIGEGPERKAIEACIQRFGLKERVTLAGAREHASRYLRAFDVFVLASKKEGMPFALLEAAAAGLPIVASDVGAHRWMLPEASFVPPQHPHALAEALLQALRQEAAPSYIESLRRFSAEACFAAHARLLGVGR